MGLNLCFASLALSDLTRTSQEEREILSVTAKSFRAGILQIH